MPICGYCYQNDDEIMSGSEVQEMTDECITRPVLTVLQHHRAATILCLPFVISIYIACN